MEHPSKLMASAANRVERIGACKLPPDLLDSIHKIHKGALEFG